MLRATIFFLMMTSFIGVQAQQVDPTLLVQVHGVVVDAISENILQATIYVLAPDTENELAITDTNTEGHYGLVLQRGATYDINVKLEGYQIFEQRLDLSATDIKEVELNIRMKKVDLDPTDR